MWVARYQGHAIIKLASGKFWSPEIGAYSTLPEIRKAIDAWRPDHWSDRPGFSACAIVWDAGVERWQEWRRT